VNQTEAAVVLRCDDGEDGCGLTFVAQANYAAKIRRGVHRQLCRRCARDAHRKYPRARADDEDRAFWLERFDDDAIVVIALAMFGRASLSSIASERERLGVPQPAANGRASPRRRRGRLVRRPRSLVPLLSAERIAPAGALA
jgi:hypothetical protein